MKIKCKECNGEGAYEVACWETSKMVNCECSYCDGQGYTEIDEEEYKSPELNEIAEVFDLFCKDISMTFTGDPSKNYHVTYFINRGDVTAEETPLLGGLTLSAESITHAVTIFINTTGVSEREIKYIVEL